MGRFKGGKGTFDFLGFTHYNSKTRKGRYTVGNKIAKKKKKIFKANVRKWIKENRTKDFILFMTQLNRKVTGSIRYDAVFGNYRDARKMWGYAKAVTFKWMNRRSQRKSFKYEKFNKVWDILINEPRIYIDIWSPKLI